MRWASVALCCLWAFACQAQAPLSLVARSVYQVQGAVYSEARLEIDESAFKRALGTRPSGSDLLPAAIAALRDGRVRFRVHQMWMLPISAKRRRELNQLVVEGVWPQGIPTSMAKALDRYLAFATRVVEPGQSWEFEGGGGQPVRGRYGDEPWTVFGKGPSVALIVGLYIDGAPTVPGTRKDFQRGLREVAERLRSK